MFRWSTVLACAQVIALSGIRGEMCRVYVASMPPDGAARSAVILILLLAPSFANPEFRVSGVCWGAAAKPDQCTDPSPVYAGE